MSQVRRGQILEHAEQSKEALQIWLHTLDDAKLMVRDCREQLEAGIVRLRVIGGATAESDDSEAASATRTGAHRQRLRAGNHISNKDMLIDRTLTSAIRSYRDRTYVYLLRC